MRMTLCAVAVTAILAGCSSGSDNNDNMPADDDDDIPPAIAPETPPDAVDDPDGGDSPAPGPVGDSKAGVWQGDIGFGDGVYIVNNANELAGIAIAADGSATSTFGNLGAEATFNGVLDNYAHSASSGAPGNAFAPGGGLFDSPITYELNIVNGQTIESLDADRPFALNFSASGTLTPATAEALAGDWVGVHTFVVGETTIAYDKSLSFSGNTVSGSTGLDDPGFSFEHTITGSIEGFGDVSTITFDWVNDEDGTTASYAGVVFFAPDGSGDIVVNTELVSGEVDTATLSSRLVRQ